LDRLAHLRSAPRRRLSRFGSRPAAASRFDDECRLPSAEGVPMGYGLWSPRHIRYGRTRNSNRWTSSPTLEYRRFSLLFFIKNTGRWVVQCR
jgi:hypothetical protein